MRIRVVAIGRSMPDWVASGWREYARRLPRQLAPDLIELPPAPTRAPDPASEEGRSLLRRAPDGVRIALHERGEAWSTRDLSTRLERWMMNGEDVSLLIGGASGHGPDVLGACRLKWSLGPLTFPHMLVRVIVAEQLYRAWTVLSGHPYHRD